MPHYALYLLVGLTRMAVLLVVADVRVAVAARQCGADPEGALSAAARPVLRVATQLVAYVAMLLVLVVANTIVIPETRDVFLVAVPLAVVLVAFVAGLALVVACANVMFRDVEHLISAALLPWFFLTPILYRLEGPARRCEAVRRVVTILRWVNPITPAIEALRAPLFYGRAAGRVGRGLPVRRGGRRAELGAWVFSRVDDQIAVEL